MDWSTLWSWYKKTNRQAQEDILKQLNLKEFLQSLAPKYQWEIMENAPMEVINDVLSVLSLPTMRKLLDKNGMVMK